MHVVDAAQRGRLAQVVQQVAEIVQQGGGDERVARAFGLAERRALQRVLQLGHRLAGVLLVAALGEQALDVFETQGHAILVVGARGQTQGRE